MATIAGRKSLKLEDARMEQGDAMAASNEHPRGRALLFVAATPAYDLAIEAAKETDERRAALGLSSDRCLPSREAMEQPATI